MYCSYKTTLSYMPEKNRPTYSERYYYYYICISVFPSYKRILQLDSAATSRRGCSSLGRISKISSCACASSFDSRGCMQRMVGHIRPIVTSTRRAKAGGFSALLHLSSAHHVGRTRCCTPARALLRVPRGCIQGASAVSSINAVPISPIQGFKCPGRCLLPSPYGPRRPYAIEDYPG